MFYCYGSITNRTRRRSTIFHQIPMRQSCVTQRNIFFSIFCIFLKNRRLWLRFQGRNDFCMQKYSNKGIFIGFTENSLFSENFRTGYSMIIFMLTAKKLIYTNLAIFGFFLSNKHDSFGFIKFCLKLIEKIAKNRK